MAKRPKRDHWQPSLVQTERQQTNALELVVNCATGKATRQDFNGLLGLVVAGNAMVPAPEEWETFRAELERGLRAIAADERWDFKSPALDVAITRNCRPSYSGAAWRWRAVELILSRQAWRLRICPWDKLLFVKRGRSEYCSPKCSSAAERDRAKQRAAAGSRTPAPAPGIDTRLAAPWREVVDNQLAAAFLAECPAHRSLDEHESSRYRHVVTDAKGTIACAREGRIRYGGIESVFPGSALQARIDAAVIRAAEPVRG